VTFEMWWVAVALGAFFMALYEAYAAGVEKGRKEGLQDARKATFADLRRALDEAHTAQERSAAWQTARSALEPPES